MQLSRIGRAKQKNCTTKITDYWSILTKIFIRTANEVYLAPARCAHEILLNLITHKSTLTKVLRNQLPPLRLSALQSPPTTLSLNLNK